MAGLFSDPSVKKWVEFRNCSKLDAKKARIWRWWLKYSVNSDVDKFLPRSGAEFFTLQPFSCLFLPTLKKVLRRGDLVGILTKKDLLHYVGEKRDRHESNNFHCLNFSY